MRAPGKRVSRDARRGTFRRRGAVEALEHRLLLTATWTGAAGTNWSDPDNWQNGRTPAVDSVVDFPLGAANKTSVNDLGQLTLATLVVHGGGYSISSALTPGDNPVASVITFNGNGLVVMDTSAGATNSFTAALHLNNSGTAVNVAADSTLTFGSLVDGNGPLNKDGTGTVVLPSANPDFDGSFNLNAGTARVEHPDALGSRSGDTQVTNVTTLELGPGAAGGAETLHVGGTGFDGRGALRADASVEWDGTVDLNRAGTSIVVEPAGSTLTLNEGLTGSDSIVKQGAGTLSLAGSSNFGGGTVEQGVLNIRAATTTGALTVNSAAAVQLQGNVTVTASGTSVLKGTGVNNAGALQNVSGNNRWDGNLRAGSNTLIFASAGTLTVDGSIDTNGFTVTGGGPGTMEFGGAVTGTGSLAKSGAGTLILSGTAANTYTGATVVNAGVLNLRKSSAISFAASPGTTVADGAVIQLQGGIDVGARRLTLNGSGPDGAGALLNVSGNNSWASPVTLAGPTTIGSASGTLTVRGPIDNAGQLLTVAGAGAVSLSPVASSVISGAGGITKTGSGTLTLGNAGNTYTGATRVDGGVLTVRGGSSLGSGIAAVIVAAGATLELNTPGVSGKTLSLAGGGVGGTGALRSVGTSRWGGHVSLVGFGATIGVPAGFLTLDGLIGGGTGAALTKIGAGTLTLNGANTYAGSTQIEEGTVLAHGATALGGAVGGTRVFPGARLTFGPAVGSSASVTFNEPLILAGTLAAEQSVSDSKIWAGRITLSPVTNAHAVLDASGSGFPISGAIVGEGTLNKIGTGTVDLFGTASNTYTGLTTVESGRLALDKEGGAIAVGGDLLVTGRAGQTVARLLFDNQLLPTANVTVTGAALLDLNNHKQTVGLLTLNGGDVATGNGLLTLGNDVVANSFIITTPVRLVFQPSMGNVNLGGGAFRSFAVGTDAGLGLPTTLTIDGVVSGAAGLIKLGSQTLLLAGRDPNTYAGATLVNEGRLQLGKTAGVKAVSGTVTVGDDAFDGADLPLDTLQWLSGDQVPDDAVITVRASGVLDLNGNNETFGPITVNGGLVETGAGTLTLGGDLAATASIVGGVNPARVTGNLVLGGSPVRQFIVPNGVGIDLVVSASITGSGFLDKVGPGQLELAGANATTFSTRVRAGTVFVTGTTGGVSVGTQAVLGGDGAVGSLFLDTSATVNPGVGNATGTLTVNGSVSFFDNATLSVDLNGNAPGSGYDQLRVNGVVDLVGEPFQQKSLLAVRVGPGFNPAAGDTFVVIDNDGTDAVIGTFSNLPEGSVVAVGAERFRISYVGGDGNDVTLTVPGGGDPPAVTGVFINNPGWAAAFRAALPGSPAGTSALGYAVPTGAAQLAAVPWSGLTQISIRFDQAVGVDQTDLQVRGTNKAQYAFSNFVLDNVAGVATWTLAEPVLNDKLVIDLDGDSPTGVRSTRGGALMDGEWANGTDTFPSGNGAGGGDFRFRINVLAGDVDRSGSVNAQDLADVKRRLNRSIGSPGSGSGAYSVFADITGDGRINATDLSAAKQRLNQRLPTAEPAALW